MFCNRDGLIGVLIFDPVSSMKVFHSNDVRTYVD